MKKTILSIAILLISFMSKAQDNIVINEIMASNVDFVIDPSFNYGSWIELYNPSSNTINSSTLFVTDDPNDLKKSPVRDNVNIGKGKFFNIWFDHYDGIFSPTQMNFKLNYDGGTIYVTDGEKILCSQEYPKAIGRVSYARTKDGSDTWAWTANPTPEASNSKSTFVSSAEKQLQAPEFNFKGGLFTSAFDLSITSPDGATIYYTCSKEKYDDSEEEFNWGWDWPWWGGGWGSNSACKNSVPTPTMQNGKKLNGKIHVGETMVIRARAFKEGYLPSEVVTRSYLFKDKAYVFPIISIATSRANLCDDEIGIMTEGYNGRPGNGKQYSVNWNMDWDRPVNFEYITADGEYALNQEVDISMCGGWSRSWTPHSFKLKAGKYYMGMNSMDYQFFDSKPNIKHKALQIRNGGNDTSCRIKDAAIQEVVRRSGLRVNTQAWQPVHVFLNGEYYDVLNMREPNNKHFAYSNYGYDTDEIDQFEISPDSGYVQKEGTDEKFLEWYELSANAADAETYKKIEELVDIEEYINYMAVELYCGTNDWARNNVKAFRHRNNGKFHFVLFDLDSAFELSGSPFTAFANKKNMTFDQLYGITGVTPWKTGDKIKAEIKFVTIFLNMLNNEDFRRKFIDSFCIVAGSVFNPNDVKTVVNEMADYMNSGLKLKNGSCTNTATSIKGSLSTTRQTEMISYLKSYTPMGLKSAQTILTNLKSNIPEGEIFINGIKVPTGKMSGKVFKPAILRATAPEGYKFLGWFKNTKDEPFTFDTEFEVVESSAYYTAKWEKMTDEEMIAQGLNATPIVINEVSASNEIYVNDLFKKSDWIELYNTTDTDQNIAGMYLTDNLDKPQKYQIPTEDVKLNTIIPAHGHKIIWCDKKEGLGEAIHADFKLEADGGDVALFRYEGDDIVYTDTLSYAFHEGTQSFGRYPDGGAKGYLMQKPTAGASNKCTSDVIDFLAAHSTIIADNTNDIKITTEGEITFAYVGQGIVNIKSTNGNLSTVRVLSSSGAVVLEKAVNAPFTSINLSTLPHSIYIVMVDGKSVKVRN